MSRALIHVPAAIVSQALPAVRTGAPGNGTSGPNIGPSYMTSTGSWEPVAPGVYWSVLMEELHWIVPHPHHRGEDGAYSNLQYWYALPEGSFEVIRETGASMTTVLLGPVAQDGARLMASDDAGMAAA